MKSIAEPALPTTAPAASVSFVTDPSATVGILASAGPPGFDPPTLTSICRASGFEATQLKKNAAQSAFLALDAMPKVNGADMAAGLPLASAGGLTKNPTLPAMFLS